LKFVFNADRTAEKLREWASGVPLAQEGFFFWNSGTVLQMSKSGLLQSLLHQIFSTYPQLLIRHLNQRWDIYQSLGNWGYDFTWLELKSVFQDVLSNQEFRFALFIDGLDEFDGEHHELISLIFEVASLKNVFICVASRPWLLFEDAFENKPNLQLEWLTENNVRRYVSDKIGQHRLFIRLLQREPSFACEV
jgi:hypothetical protein